MSLSEDLREHLRHVLDWEDAHAGFDTAVEGIDPALRGVVPDGAPYSAWQLLEHLRRAQRDILDFCRNPSYAHQKWPDDYWPREAAPANATEWDESVAAFRRDRGELIRLAGDREVDLASRIPHGKGQTYLRELLLVADHNAYHVGQLVLLRRLLGAWMTT